VKFLPSQKVLAEKQQLVEALAEKLKGSVAGVLVDYKGINVADDTKLRADLRKAQVQYTVEKNTMLRFAIEKAGLDDLASVLAGTTALAVSQDDHVAAAKQLSQFAATHKGFTIKAGFIDGKAISPAEVDALAKLPSKEQLLSKALGGLNAPISGLVYVLNANLTGLAVALNAIAEQKAQA